MENLKVSVCMIAYNHQSYIAKALDSILGQQTNFPFEIVIGDDNSKDDTEKICRSYAEKFPGKIRYHRREKNIGMMPNFIEMLYACKGEYIAICEGDDYWTDPVKLQMQSDFLDAHPDHALSCHNHHVLVKGLLRKEGKSFSGETRPVSTEEYLLDPFFHTTSYFFRNTAMPRPFPGWYYNVLAGDHFLVLFISMKGKMSCLNRRMSVFRNHGSSVSFTRTPLDLKTNFVHHLKEFNEYSRRQFDRPINQVIRRWNLVYKVYEPVSYFNKISHLIANTGFYLRNFKSTGGLKLLVKYLVPYSIIRWIKSKL